MQSRDDNSGPRREVQASVRLALWTAAWIATLALATFGPKLWWNDLTAVSWIAVAVDLAAGLGWILAYASYLRGIDELWRKINQDALAVTLGAGFVVGFAYVVSDSAGLIPYDLSIALFPILLAVVYLATIAVGWIRYR